MKPRALTSMCSTTSGKTTPRGARRDEWAPCLILVQGFAPWGATAAEKLRQQEVASIQNDPIMLHSGLQGTPSCLAPATP